MFRYSLNNDRYTLHSIRHERRLWIRVLLEKPMERAELVNSGQSVALFASCDVPNSMACSWLCQRLYADLSYLICKVAPS